eukprot:946109-Rhodomonas_salina.5
MRKWYKPASRYKSLLYQYRNSPPPPPPEKQRSPSPGPCPNPLLLCPFPVFPSPSLPSLLYPAFPAPIPLSPLSLLSLSSLSPLSLSLSLPPPHPPSPIPYLNIKHVPDHRVSEREGGGGRYKEGYRGRDSEIAREEREGGRGRGRANEGERARGREGERERGRERARGSEHHLPPRSLLIEVCVLRLLSVLPHPPPLLTNRPGTRARHPKTGEKGPK